jgi:predicted Zn-ribbon and HTH transcriptional regulator
MEIISAKATRLTEKVRKLLNEVKNSHLTASICLHIIETKKRKSIFSKNLRVTMLSARDGIRILPPR